MTPHCPRLIKKTSPFLSSLARTLAARKCLKSIVAKDDAEKQSIQRAISDISDFLGTLTAKSTTEPKTKSKDGSDAVRVADHPCLDARSPVHRVDRIAALLQCLCRLCSGDS